MRSKLRIIIASVFMLLVVSAHPLLAACEGGYSVPQEWDSTFRYYNSLQQMVGYERYLCGGGYVAHGTLHGTWMEETDIDCCTGQTQHQYFYFCNGDWWEVDNLGDINCE
ncbi:MAG: hypothetical protein DMF56_25095 [Acidobacteria bacterium]|nr:MAG: hypothetical protein DMF56_25095 [Acidobacteriota bacterium]